MNYFLSSITDGWDLNRKHTSGGVRQGYHERLTEISVIAGLNLNCVSDKLTLNALGRERVSGNRWRRRAPTHLLMKAAVSYL